MRESRKKVCRQGTCNQWGVIYELNQTVSDLHKMTNLRFEHLIFRNIDALTTTLNMFKHVYIISAVPQGFCVT